MKTRLAVLVLMSAASAFGAYTYDYSNPWFYYLGTSTFASNGAGLGGALSSYGTYFYWSSSGPGSEILIPSVSGNANDYEVNTQLLVQAGGGTVIHFLRASSNALAASGSCTGSYVSVELTVSPTYTGGVAAATLAINQCSAGTQSSLGGVSLGVSNNAILRSVVYGTTLLVYLNNDLIVSMTVPATTGQPGVGGYGTGGGVGFPYNPATGDSMIEIGHHDTVAPNTVSATGLRTSIFPTKASLQWQGATDDTSGIGVWGYTIARNGTTIGNVDGAEFADSTVSASTTYTYSISAIDFHGNVGSATTFSVTTPPATAVDPRRTGVASTGSYWGGGGEQIDMLSGNLNFSLPLVSPQGRPGWTVPVGLSYNSQNWRQDSGTNWELGTDVGYGYGWSVQIGSITPFYLGTGSGVDHYVYTDGTGATYLLNQNSGSIWSSSQGIYVWFDASANLLHFKNGMFWYMGCTSGGAEQDASTMYPTVIEDVGGNQVIVTYNGAPSLPAGELNTSGRILEIQDVRAGAVRFVLLRLQFEHAGSPSDIHFELRQYSRIVYIHLRLRGRTDATLRIRFHL